MKRLEGKVALVTGAAQGIGEAIAMSFASNGASAYITDINDPLGRAVAARLGGNGRSLHLDVRRETDWEVAMSEIATAQARLDILVNNAGITGFDDNAGPQDPEHVSLDRWREVHATNLEGVMLGCKHGIRAMRSLGKGSIINMGSRSGIVGIPAAAAYASSKAAVRNHTKTVALYCAEQGLAIRCNVIQPAAILTPMWETVLGRGPEREERLREFAKDCPLGRFGTVEEVAALAVHLASDESAYTTGAEFTLDGGILAGTAAPPAPKAGHR